MPPAYSASRAGGMPTVRASDRSVFTSTLTREPSLRISTSGCLTEIANSGWSLPFFLQATGA